MAGLCLLLLIHAIPGFDARPPDQVTAREIRFDKAVVVFALLGVYAPREGFGAWRAAFSRRILVLMTTTIALVLGLGMAVGYLALEIDAIALPVALAWASNNLLLTCTFEEGFFRGLIQHRLASAWSSMPYGPVAALMLTALLFGAAHLGGGTTFAVLATLAGVGYGAVYLLSGRLESAIATHFLLNATHYFLLTYPNAAG